MTTNQIIFQNKAVNSILFIYYNDNNTLEFIDESDNFIKIELEKISNNELKQHHIPTFTLSDCKKYILHSRHPIYIAQIKGNDIKVINEITPFVPDAKKIAGLMRRMGDWYMQYIKNKK